MNWISYIFKPRKKIQTTHQLFEIIGSGGYYELSRWLIRNIWYRKDTSFIDEWKPSTKTLKEGKGDCEDFAIIAYEVLSLMGYITKILCVYPVKGAGHAVCAFYDGIVWRYFSNGRLSNKIKRYEDIPKTVALEMRCELGHSCEADVNGRTKSYL